MATWTKNRRGALVARAGILTLEAYVRSDNRIAWYVLAEDGNDDIRAGIAGSIEEATLEAEAMARSIAVDILKDMETDKPEDMYVLVDAKPMNDDGWSAVPTDDVWHDMEMGEHVHTYQNWEWIAMRYLDARSQHNPVVYRLVPLDRDEEQALIKAIVDAYHGEHDDE